MKQGFGNVNGSTGGAISPARRQEVLRSCWKQESVNERKYGNSQTTGQPVVTLILIFTLFSLSSIVISCSDDLPLSQLALLQGLLVFIERPKKSEGAHGHICFRR